jgi:hypothetical protein
MKKHFLLIFALVISISSGGWCQRKLDVSFPTPTATSFGIFGQIPVSYFNGLPNIGVPLYTLQDYGISMPIDLSYHASGVRPDMHPGWVGLGWNLSAGGVITRIANGDIDEKLDPTVTNNHSRSYFDNYDGLKDTPTLTWASDPASMIIPILNNYFGFTGTNRAMPAPDEFTFNFNGYSGSFFLDHNHQWKIRSSNGKAIKISTVSTNPFTLPATNASNQAIQLGRIIDKIELITPDGATYTFGGTQESIEFSRSPGEHDAAFTQVIASSWFLTKIKTPTGKEIILNYERDGYSIVNSESWSNQYVTNGNSSTGPGNYTSSTLLNPSYLKEIVTDNQTVSFTRTLSTELIGPEDAKSFGSDGPSGGGNLLYPDIDISGSRWFKLTRIDVKDNWTNQGIKRFDFSYSDRKNNQPTRLMLTGVQEMTPDGIAARNPYLFSYEDDPSFDLPPYVSRKLDHWGFFNNTNFFEGRSTVGPSDEAAYTSSRDTKPEYLKEGTLNSITYPTGGKTRFEYEANDYSYVAHNYDVTPWFGVTGPATNGSKQYAGGLRIRKITSSEGTSPDIVKEFFYETEDSIPNSSGILGGMPKYLETYSAVSGVNCTGINRPFCVYWDTPDYTFFYNHTVLPMSFTAGSHVTYSRVKEVLSDGSYNVYKYTNHDNPDYRDVAIKAAAYRVVAESVDVPVTDMSYVRGKLLTQETFSSSTKLLKKVTYQYNSKPERFDDCVRIAVIKLSPFTGINPTGQISAYNKYLFEPYVTGIVTDTYNQLTNNYVTQAVSMEYDDANLLLKKQTTQQSDGTDLISTYRYPGDKASLSPSFSAPDLLVVDQMIGKNVISPILETETYKGADFLGRSSTTFKKWGSSPNEFFMPSMEKTRNVRATQDKINGIYDNYDSNGNLLGVLKNGVTRTSYKWGYNGQFPVVKIDNANVNEFFAEDFENDLTISPSAAHTGVRSTTGPYQHAFVRPNARKYELSYWEYSGGIWSLHVQPYTTDLISISSTLPLDDILVRPTDALASTYTYAPLKGMLSQISANGVTNYYDYDMLNRLYTIRDPYGKILKTFCYNYAGQLGGCNIPSVYTNHTRTRDFQKGDCGEGYSGSWVTYMVNEGAYTSTVSREAADLLADADLTANGPSYANSHGTCSALPSTIYARVEISNQTTSMFHDNPRTRGDVYIKLYSNSACTIPYTLTGSLSVNVSEGTTVVIDYGSPDSSTSNASYSIPVGSSSYYIGNKILDMVTVFFTDTLEITYDTTYSFDVATGTGYIVSPTLIN